MAELFAYPQHPDYLGYFERWRRCRIRSRSSTATIPIRRRSCSPRPACPRDYLQGAGLLVLARSDGPGAAARGLSGTGRCQARHPADGVWRVPLGDDQQDQCAGLSDETTGHTNPTTTIRKSFVRGQVWNPSQWNDPEYDKKWMRVYLEQDEPKRQAMLKGDDPRDSRQGAVYLAPHALIFTAWWPWGEELRRRAYAPARSRPGPIYARIWIDQDLKKRLGALSGQRPMTRPLLDVKNLTTRFRTDRGTVTAVDGVSFHVDPGETARDRRRESGSGKSVTALSVLRLIPNPPGPDRERRNPVRGVDLTKLDDPGIRAGARQQDRDDLSGADVVAQSGLDRRAAGGRARSTCTEARLGQKPMKAATELIGRVPHRRRRQPTQLLSASIFRRHAPARHDRDGAGLCAAPDHRGRADHSTRRHRAGADSRSAQGGDARDRLVADPDHPRISASSPLCRPRRRDVWRAHCRGGAGARSLQASKTSLYASA